MSNGDYITRFSDRAENYDRFRPTYPSDLIAFLRAHSTLRATQAIADIAAGTGIFTEQIATWGNKVYVVEPNPFMRQLAVRRLAAFDNCLFVDGTAESTGLEAGSVSLIVSAQAFHWFDLEKAKAEFLRIGGRNANVAIIWNTRNSDSVFEISYEQLIRKYAVDYLAVSQHKMNPSDVQAFFTPVTPLYRAFAHVDHLTFERLRGRTLSYSYMPNESSPALPDVLNALTALFNTCQENGTVRLSYTTRLYIGRITGD
ncbi:class I SAM-dependent methyltransferase [Parapedobacter sp. DT-150]|uniref:class I SAM-dependent methyltransferase n=1 Tax=Parapedobacter sp. DT-150 TaxID=3396162 RepID=UPI003F1B0B1E